MALISSYQAQHSFNDSIRASENHISYVSFAGCDRFVPFVFFTKLGFITNESFTFCAAHKFQLLCRRIHFKPLSHTNLENEKLLVFVGDGVRCQTQRNAEEHTLTQKGKKLPQRRSKKNGL